MKANELRIGNFIEVNGKVEKIWALDLDLQDESWPLFSAGKHANVGIREFKESDLKYIQLTEEWFENFGAKSDDLEIDSYVLSSLTCDYRFFKSTTIDGDIYWTCEKVLGDTIIQYVHQLQNLYFALTGNELELK